MSVIESKTVSGNLCNCSIAAEKESLEYRKVVIANQAYVQMAGDISGLFMAAGTLTFLLGHYPASRAPTFLMGACALSCLAIRSIFLARINALQELSKLNSDLAKTHQVCTITPNPA